MPNFLLEIGTEELPAGFINPALESLVESFSSLLRDQNLSFKNVKTMGTPRRLSVFVDDLPVKQPDQTKEVLGPRESIAFDPTGNPTQALIGFARRHNLKPDEVKTKDSPKGKVCYVILKSRGEATRKLLPGIVIQAIRRITSPKSMWWSDKSVSFSRPIRYFTALLGKDAVKIELADITSSNKTYGHHLLSPKPITLRSANLSQYKNLLKRAYVMIDPKERRGKVIREINGLLKKHGSEITNRDMDLVDEVTNMLECPTAIKGAFNKDFLDLPESVLAVALKKQQYYFPVYNKAGRLQPYFIVLANNIKRNSSLIKDGNERVLRARLTDAMFFWERDRKIDWATRLDGLKEIAYLKGLGSFAEKVQRIKYLCGIITNDLDSPQEIRHSVIRAAELCKFDLLTEMVGEFPELQGLMGYEYMKLQGESQEVALAIKEHYQPRFQQDQLPKGTVGVILALAEKFDNLVACFTMGLRPSGSQDPFALRRQVLGIIKIILENKLNLSLKKIIFLGIDQVIGTISRRSGIPMLSGHSSQEDKFSPATPEVIYEAIRVFIEDRLYQLCLEDGYPHELIRAALACGFDHLPDLKSRLDSLVKLQQSKSWGDLVTVVERTYNIGKKVDPALAGGAVKPDLFRTPEENNLWKIYQADKPRIQTLIDDKKYYDASLLYAKSFARPVHDFFDKVFVNVEEMDLRRNRIALMRQLNELYSAKIADLSVIALKSS